MSLKLNPNAGVVLPTKVPSPEAGDVASAPPQPTGTAGAVSGFAHRVADALEDVSELVRGAMTKATDGGTPAKQASAAGSVRLDPFMAEVRELVNRTPWAPTPKDFTAAELVTLRSARQVVQQRHDAGTLTADEKPVARTLLQMFKTWGE